MKKGIVVGIVLSCILCMSAQADGVTGIEPTKDANGNSIPEELVDFKYDLQGDEIMFEAYEGDDKVITIYGSYEIDGKEYETNLEDFEANISGSVEAVIFEEGVKTLSHALFNMSNVQKVYFPLTMENVEDGTLSYLYPENGNEFIEIYYEGTQDQWNEIFTKYEDMTMEKAETADEYGWAAADWLNNLIGAGYDSSQFMYYFEATPEDLIESLQK